MFRKPLEEVWQETETFWRERDPVQLERAERDEKHRMSLTLPLVSRQSSRWANAGVEERRADFQIWCVVRHGPPSTNGFVVPGSNRGRSGGQCLWP